MADGAPELLSHSVGRCRSGVRATNRVVPFHLAGCVIVPCRTQRGKHLLEPPPDRWFEKGKAPVTIWAVIITIAVCALAAIQYALLRQVGIMLVRLGPGSARPLYQGPRQGEYLGLKFETLWKEKRQSLPTLYIF